MKLFEFDYNGQKRTCIAKEELVDGAYYKGECRNADIARWDAQNEVFVYIRHKFGDGFAEPICHPQDEDHYDVFCVDELIENPPFDIPFANREV